MTQFAPGDEVVVMDDIGASQVLKVGDNGIVANPAYTSEGFLRVKHSDGNTYAWHHRRWALVHNDMPDTRDYLNVLSRIGR